MPATYALALIIVILLAIATFAYFRTRHSKAEPKRPSVSAGPPPARDCQLPLPPPLRERYVDLWKANQYRLAEDPTGAVLAAGDLITEIMRHYGLAVYDLDDRDPDRNFADPHIALNYRTGMLIVRRYLQGELFPEELGNAMLCFRDVFAALVDRPAQRSSGARA